jgi:CelD/BcsL family acetyltransferase involved in cellulose biosynthesis
MSATMPIANAFVAPDVQVGRAALDVPASWRAAAILVERADAARLAALDADWRDLVTRSDEPNVFMDPALLHLAGDSCITLLARNGESKLMGVWAFSVARHPVLPMKLLRAPALPYSYLATPVVDRTAAHAVIAALLDFIASDAALPKLISLEPIRTDGSAMHALTVALADRNSAPYALSEGRRPVLESGLDAKQYFEKALSGSSRKKLRQHRRRLEEKGKLDSRISTTLTDVAPAFEDFLVLEAAGWKGRGGTALLCNDAEAKLVRGMVAALAKRGDAWVHALHQNGKMVAAQIVLRAGATAFTWKTAYDETLGDFSPGMLLLEDYTAAFLADKSIARVDSCSLDETGFMSAWSERQEIAHLLIGARQGKPASFAIAAGAYKAFLQVRTAVKQVYLRGRRLWKRR